MIIIIWIVIQFLETDLQTPHGFRKFHFKIRLNLKNWKIVKKIRAIKNIFGDFFTKILSIAQFF
jgi:hypothetical protein